MSALVFNRRKRRTISRAKKVLVHLFAGDSRKEIERIARARGYEVISVGEKEDINSPQTFGYLLQRAALGELDALWSAPPCSTNSLCRFIPPRPQPLRGRTADTRWGLQDLSEPERRKATRADEMYLRMLLLMHVAADGRERLAKAAPWALIENPEDPERYVDKSSKLWERARKHGGFPSFFATEEFRTSAGILGLMSLASGLLRLGRNGHQE